MPSPPLSIGIVTSTLSRSGGGIFPIVRAHAQGLAALSATSVTVFGLRDAATEQDLESWRPVIPITYQPLIPRFGFASKLSDDLQHSSHDVIHQHGLWLYPSIAVARWRRSSGKPTVISTQGMLEPWAIANSALKKRIAGVLFERSNLTHAACIHCSEAEVEGIRAYGLRNPIAVIPNGVDIPDHAMGRLVRPHWMSGDRRRTLLFLGRLHPKKGIQELVRAWSRVTTEFPMVAQSWLLAIAGWDDGGHAAEVQALTTELGLDSRSVVFPGPLFGADKVAALSHADAFILPSHSEGFPMTVLEAWAHGLPVFMTRACNISVGFEAGAAIEVTTEPDALARVLASSLTRADLPGIGFRGRELAASRFSWASIVAELRSVYEWLTDRGSRPSCVRMD
jgi:glycosyltransferase involved in cell wall biosynthesis